MDRHRQRRVRRPHHPDPRSDRHRLHHDGGRLPLLRYPTRSPPRLRRPSPAPTGRKAPAHANAAAPPARTHEWRKREGARYVGRGTPWGNPYAVVRISDGRHAVPDPHDTLAKPPVFTSKQEARAEAVRRYRPWLDARPHLIDRARRELAGRDLLCWCPLTDDGNTVPCHADVLLHIANTPAPRPATTAGER
ncbi:DUF4326 domain-containing protein [Streptomyces nanshensis]|uniref:DUF4326 domain-containing protein n=1 Tax=Streptomyces nanshensis TaxID=518642 RepID=UPI001C0BFD35|nr:DUF4326 domain-containing protein [Streptomyces nanshensis]